MKMTGYLDVLIPRGGAGLIKSVVDNAKVPVIETGVGNCHIYIDKAANPDMAADIVFNAKTSRPSVSMPQKRSWFTGTSASTVLPCLRKRLAEKEVQLRGRCGSLLHTSRRQTSRGRRMESGIPGLCAGDKSGRQHRRSYPSHRTVFHPSQRSYRHRGSAGCGQIPPFCGLGRGISQQLPLVLPTEEKWDWAQKSAYPPRSFTPEALGRNQLTS